MNRDSPPAKGSFLKLLLLGVLLTIGLIWPAYLNGQAFFFSDTSAYVKCAASGVAKFLGRQSVWLDTEKRAPAPPEWVQKSEIQVLPENASSPEGKGVLAGRSVFYGALILLTSAAATLWATVLVQAAFAALTLLSVSQILLGQKAQARIPSSLALSVLVVVGSSLPMFCSLLMPDVFAGLLILATAGMLADPSRRRRYMLAWSAVISLALLFHTANFLILGCTVAGTLLFDVCSRSKMSARLLQGYGLILLSIVIGLCGEAAFDYGVVKGTGLQPIRPPFLMARLISDGPGKDWIKTHCPTPEFIICNYTSNLGSNDADDFLWSTDPKIGVFNVVDQAHRRILAKENFRFGLEVMKEYPGSVLLSSARNFWTQLWEFKFGEFNYSALGLEIFRIKLPPNDYFNLLESKAAKITFPSEDISDIDDIVLGVSTITTIFLLATRYRRTQRQILRAVSIIYLGILINAMVCGALSTPHDRYQARVVWLIPVLTALLYYSSRQDKIVSGAGIQASAAESGLNPG